MSGNLWELYGTQGQGIGPVVCRVAPRYLTLTFHDLSTEMEKL